MFEDAVRPLRRGLAHLRTRVRTLVFVHGSARLLVFLVVSLAVLFMADYLLRLPVGVRRVAFFVLVIGTVAVAFRRILGPLSRPLSDERLAARVEAANPDLKDRLASSLAFARAGTDEDNEDSPELMRAVIEETVALAPRIAFTKVARATSATRWAVAALALLLSFAGLAAADQQRFAIFLRRNLLWQDVEWPRRTTLHVEDMTPGEPNRVTRGREATIRVRAEGSIPERIEFSYWEADSDRRAVERIDLDPSPDDPSLFTLNLPVYTSYKFTVTGGDDDRGQVYFIEALTPPSILQVEVACQFPDYLGRESEVRLGGDQRVPQGSRLELRVRTNLPIERTAVAVGAESEIELERLEPTLFLWKVTVDQDIRYSVRLHGGDGQENDPGIDTFILRALKDRAPLIRVRTPSNRTSRAVDGVLLVNFVVRDDHEVSHAALAYSLEEGLDTGAENTISLGSPSANDDKSAVRLLTAPSADPNVVAGLAVFDLSRLKGADGKPPRPRQFLNYRILATDSSGQVKETRPRRVEFVDQDSIASDVQGKQETLRETVDKTIVRTRDVITQMGSVQSALATAGQPESELRGWTRKAQSRQARVTQDLRRILAQVVRVTNLYVFNRLDDQSAADRMLPFFERHLLGLAEDASAPFRGTLYRDIWGAIQKRELRAGGSLRKLCEMADLADRLAQDHAPTAYRSLDELALVKDPDAANRHFRIVVREQQAIAEGLDRLARLTKQWQSYEGVVRQFKALRKIERDVVTATENLSEK